MFLTVLTPFSKLSSLQPNTINKSRTQSRILLQALHHIVLSIDNQRSRERISLLHMHASYMQLTVIRISLLEINKTTFAKVAQIF